MRYRISILYILPAQHHILHKSHYIYLCFGYTVDIPNLGPWSPLITQAKNDLLDRLIALQRLHLWAQGQQAAGCQPTAEAIQIAPPAAAARQTAVEATAAASAEPAEVEYNTETQC